jgi:opacity protein-like surface antigen
MVRHVVAAAFAVAFCLSPSWLSAQTMAIKVSVASANVHKFPSVGSPVIGTAERGAILDVTRELGDWVRVSWPEAEDGAGYMHLSAGTMTSSAYIRDSVGAVARKSTKPQPAAEPQQAAAETPQPAAVAPRPAAAAPKPVAAAPKPAAAKPQDAKAARRTAALSAPRSSTPAAASPAPATASASNGEQGAPLNAQVTPIPTQYIQPPSHFIGLGGNMMGTSPVGFGAAVRTWSRGQPSFQMTLSHSTQTSLTAPGEVASLQIAPSLLYSLRDRLSDYLWVRPYIGGGVTYVRDSLRDITPGVTDSTKNGFGWQGFGGAEFTFPSVPKFTLSADVGYYWRPDSFEGFERNRIGISVSAHWYVK